MSMKDGGWRMRDEKVASCRLSWDIRRSRRLNALSLPASSARSMKESHTGPRALPWAGMSDAVGVCNRNFCSSEYESVFISGYQRLKRYCS
jgi:hypothetical protein